MERIRSVKTYNFRALADQEVEIPDGLTVLIGENMQGKTSFLEAIFLATTGRSVRSRDVTEVVRWGENMAQVQAQVDGQNLSVSITREPRGRTFLLNGQPISGVESPLAGNVLYYCDEYLDLLSTPSGRRRLVDRLVELSDRDNLRLAADYRKLLAERNAMLSSGFFNEALNAVLVEKLDRISEEWRAKRTKFMQLMATSLNLRFPYVFEETFKFDFKSYDSSIRDLDLELRKKVTLFGYHRDRVYLYVNGKPLESFASRGFYKIILSFMFVRTAEMMHDKNHYVLLLMDDFNANIDEPRWQRLLKLLPERHIIAASTSKWANLDLGHKVSLMTCEQGIIKNL